MFFKVRTFQDFKETFQNGKFVEFDWTDALRLEGNLTEEEVMVRDSAKAYAQEKLMPR